MVSMDVCKLRAFTWASPMATTLLALEVAADDWAARRPCFGQLQTP